MDEFLTKSMKKTKRTGLLQEAWMPGLEATEFNLLDDADIDEGVVRTAAFFEGMNRFTQKSVF